MCRSIFFAATLLVAVFVSGCGGSGGSTSPGNGELPEGINTRPLENGATPTPGIPANSGGSSPSEGTTPTPGIPANSKEATVPTKGTTPTPGIPDPETIRRQLNRKDLDANVVNQAPPSDSKTERDPFARPRKAGNH